MALTPFVWDRETGRYRNRHTGRFVTFRELRAALDSALLSARNRIGGMATALQRGRISPQEWGRRMQEQLTVVHVYSAALARGGWAQMTERDMRTLQVHLYHQMSFFNRFLEQIIAGLPMDGSFFVRVAMYVNASRATFNMVQRDVMAELGKTHERNILHPAEHCTSCVNASELGWVPLGTLLPIGDRQCLTNCRCTIEYR